MRLAEAALHLADRIGAVQSSIELRLLLGCYACDRNELWSADEWLREAHRRAVAVGDEGHQLMAEIQLGECALRRGQLARRAGVDRGGRSQTQRHGFPVPSH